RDRWKIFHLSTILSVYILRWNAMEYKSINFGEKLSNFSEHWAPKIIAQMNNYHFKVVKFQGEFVWHSHDDTDEVFIVLDGEMSIAFRDGSVELKTGEMFVVPKGFEHKPFAQKECKAMLVEPAGTINTGGNGGKMTAKDNVWI
ncbi:MAG: cupin domain-containing protein, partial [Desulfatirhabdiaceae bacterium]